jgi:hypothetical protein
MSRYDYVQGREIAAMNYPFFALIQAAMRQADTDNLGALRRAFPEVWEDLQARYVAPGGILPDDQEENPARRPITTWVLVEGGAVQDTSGPYEGGGEVEVFDLDILNGDDSEVYDAVVDLWTLLRETPENVLRGAKERVGTWLLGVCQLHGIPRELWPEGLHA